MESLSFASDCHSVVPKLRLENHQLIGCDHRCSRKVLRQANATYILYIYIHTIYIYIHYIYIYTIYIYYIYIYYIYTLYIYTIYIYYVYHSIPTRGFCRHRDLWLQMVPPICPCHTTHYDAPFGNPAAMVDKMVSLQVNRP